MKLPGRSLVVLVAVIVAGLGGRVEAATTVLSDCIDNLGEPTSAEVTTICNAQPGCNATSWTWNTGNCSYTTSFTPGTQGAWTPVHTDQTVHDCCSSTTCGSVQKSLTVSGSSTASVSGSYTGSLSSTVQGGINTGLVSATSGITVEHEFSIGGEVSSTVDKSDTDTFTASTLPCGKKIYYYVMFAADRPATGSLTLTLTAVCRHTTCTPNPSAAVTFKSSTTGLTLAGSEKARKFTECDLACPGPYDDPEAGCTKSATSTQTCHYNTYP